MEQFSSGEDYKKFTDTSGTKKKRMMKTYTSFFLIYSLWI